MVSSLNTANLSNLLPYKTETKMKGDLSAALKEYSLLCTATKQAMDAFRRGDFEQFDAVVGENACQIRAAKIAMIALRSPATDDALKSQIIGVENKIRDLSIPTALNSLMRNAVSLQALLDKEALDIALTSDEVFLTLSFLLCQAKTVLPSDALSPLLRKDVATPKKLQKFGDVTGKFTDNLVKKLRQLLSIASVAFVQNLAQALEDDQLKRMCGQEFTINYNSWQSIPMFWTYKTILQSAQKAGVPLVIDAKFLDKDEGFATVREKCLFFQPSLNAKGSFYEELVPYKRDLAKAAIVVQGVVCCSNRDQIPSNNLWKASLASNPIGVILAGAADHRQYPDPDEDRRIERLRDAEYEGYKRKARREGYSLENPGMFFIQHVYTTTVGRMELLTKKTRLAEQVIGVFSSKPTLEEWPQRVVTQIISNLEKEWG